MVAKNWRLEDINHFDQVVASGKFPKCRQLFDQFFLHKAIRGIPNWENRLPVWFSYYADTFDVSDQKREQRLCALERVLFRLSSRSGWANHRRQLAKSLTGPNGFAAYEALFEVSVLYRAFSLPREWQVEPYPKVRPNSAKTQDLSAMLDGRKVFLDATFLRLRGTISLPKSGKVLTKVEASRKRLRNKLQEKRQQFSNDSPNILLVAHMSADPRELDTNEVEELACEEFLKDPLVSGIAVFRFYFLTGFSYRCSSFSSEAMHVLTPKERNKIVSFLSVPSPNCKQG